MGRLGKEQINIIKREMAGLSGKEAAERAVMLAMQFGCDVSRIYEHSRDVRPKRKERADKGRYRIDEEILKTYMYYTVKYDFSAPHLVTEIAAGNNLPTLAPGSYNRILRKEGLSRRKLKHAVEPFRRWEAERPNQIHQIDTTVAQQFYIDWGEGGIIGYEPPTQRYKNKPGNRKQRLTLFSLVDDYSRTKFAMFIPGNHTVAWMKALYAAWRVKENPSIFPFCGIPEIIYADNDSVIKSKKFVRAMDILGVDVKKHEVGNSKAKGKVENSLKILQEFEKITKIKQFDNLDEMNKALFDYLVYINNRVHRTTGEVPFARWLRIGVEYLRNVPNEDLFRLLHMDWDTRKIYPDLHIHLGGQEFQLPHRKPFVNHIGEFVEVYWYPGDLSRIYVVIDNRDYEITPTEVKTHKAGEYRAVTKPDWLKKKEEIEQMEDPGLELYGFYEREFGRTWLPKQPQEFDHESVAEQISTQGTMRSKIWFIRRLQEECLITIDGPPLPDEMQFIDSVFDNQQERLESELEDIIKKIHNGEIVIHRQSNFGVA